MPDPLLLSATLVSIAGWLFARARANHWHAMYIDADKWNTRRAGELNARSQVISDLQCDIHKRDRRIRQLETQARMATESATRGYIIDFTRPLIIPREEDAMRDKLLAELAALNLTAPQERATGGGA